MSTGERAQRRDTDTLKQTTLNKAYARWAPVYDIVFGAVFDRGRKASIEAAERIGGRILDVGIGTGISLLDFSRDNRVVGVDISEPMLRQAHRRVIEHDLANVECLAVMDAEKLGFPDAAFDVVVAQYVITAVPNPDATLDELVRVTKPGGESHSGQSHRRRQRVSPRVRALLCASGAPPGLASGISLGPHRRVAGAYARRAPDRTAANAAARAFFADTARQGGRRPAPGRLTETRLAFDAEQVPFGVRAGCTEQHAAAFLQDLVGQQHVLRAAVDVAVAALQHARTQRDAARGDDARRSRSPRSRRADASSPCGCSASSCTVASRPLAKAVVDRLPAVVDERARRAVLRFGFRERSS